QILTVLLTLLVFMAPTRVLPMNSELPFEQLVNEAELILIAQVTKITEEEVTISVEGKPLKGDAPATLIIVSNPGFEDDASFTRPPEPSRVILFLLFDGKNYSVYGGRQGKYTIENGKVLQRGISEKEFVAHINKILQEENKTSFRKRNEARDLINLVSNPSFGIKEKESARKKLDALKGKYKVETFIDVLNNTSIDKDTRVYAAKELGTIPDPRSTKPLAWTCLADEVGEIREAAYHSLKALKPTGVEEFYLKGLRHVSPNVRARGIFLLQDIGNRSVIKELVEHLVIISSASPRVHVYYGRDFTYIQDLEVVSGSLAYDPVLATGRTGVVLDVQIIKVEQKITLAIERRLVGQALNNLAGQDFGDDPKKWAAWWNENKTN
ncbi:MAG: HEAT repeat domain-containing protein, partial [Planctomycetota bacterium]